MYVCLLRQTMPRLAFNFNSCKPDSLFCSTCWASPYWTLRINLTLILLTWRRWWTPNNASKQQMGFNSAFKELMSWFSTTFALGMHNFVITSYNRGTVKAACKSPIGLRRKKTCSHASRSPLIHVVGRSFCLYTDSLFAQIGDSKDKCSSSL